MKLKHAKKNSGFTLVELLVVIAIIAALAAISSPIIIRQIARSRATQAINNSKDIMIGLRDMSIAEGNLATRQGNANLSLASAFGGGYIVDEKPFFVSGVAGAIEGDGDLTGVAWDRVAQKATAGKALETNSNVFAYFDDGTVGINVVTAVANVPVLATPVVKAGVFNAVVYQNAAFGGQAVVVRADASAAASPLNPTSFKIADTAATTVKDTAGTDLGATVTCELPDLSVALKN